MNMLPTPDSSTIAAFGYDEDRDVLIVQFKSGSTYEYYDVPVNVFTQMSGASSKGQFLAKNIKGSYRYARV